MGHVYLLEMIDRGASSGAHTEGFMIGLFSSYSKAEQVAVRYLREVPGFRDYDVTYQIREKRVIGDADGSSSLYLICGWDLDESLDEVDIVESDCYVLREDAAAALARLRARHARAEWSLDRYMLDSCLWEDGFVRA